MYIFYDHSKCPFSYYVFVFYLSLSLCFLYSICTWSFRMFHVEMSNETTPKEALVAIQKRKTNAQKSTTPPRHSARLGSASSSSSPLQKDKSPASGSKKIQKPSSKKSTKFLDSESEGDDETPTAEADKPPDYKDRVVSTTNSDNRPAIGKVGGYIPEEKGYEITFTYSDDLEPKEHVDFCPQHWVEANLVAPETATAWAQAVDKALDGTNTSRKRKEPSPPEKRNRVSSTFYKPHENTPQAKRRGKKKKTSSVSSDLVQDNMDEGTKALLSHTVRDAIYDIRPHPDRPRLKPYLYWNPEKKKACVKMLLKRSVALQALAKDGSNEKAFCSKYAAHVTGVSNNERSMQKRQLKQLFLNNDSEYALVSNYVVGSMSPTTDEQEMGISKALTPEFETVKDLRKAICSPKMYTYPLLFDVFCAGLESGKLRSTKAMPLSRIEQVITVAHEAHFRLELWFSLRGGNHSHDSSKHSIKERRAKFGEFARFVKEDRHDNAEKAFENRRAAGPPTENDSDSDDDSDDGVEEDFY